MFINYLFFIMLIHFVALQTLFADNRLTIQDPKSGFDPGKDHSLKLVLVK